tara:strand:- start:280 stop:912 length:633 start_codon:yes stop_codon:yes gene_type:complete
MLLQWKIRTNHSNAIDIFDKVSGMHKENGAEFTTLGVLTGADNGSFALSVNFKNYESYGLMDDAWNNSNGKWDQLIEPNLGSDTQLIETMYMRKIVGNIDGPNDKLSVWSIWLFECDDQQAVMDSFEIDWKHYNSNGCTGLNIMSTSGADYPRPNQYVFAARFDSMTQLGKHFDKTMENNNYWNEIRDYHSKIKIIKNYNLRMLKRQINN